LWLISQTLAQLVYSMNRRIALSNTRASSKLEFQGSITARRPGTA